MFLSRSRNHRFTQRRGGSASAMVAIAIAIAIAMSVAGCGGGDAPTAADDELRLGSIVAPSTLDPVKTTTPSDYVTLRLIYDRILETDPRTQEVKPGLAEDWKYNDDNTVLTLTLRDGVKFHDGESVDAAAVKISLDRAIKMATVNRITSVKSVEVTGPLELTLTLSRADSTVTSALADYSGMVISPKSIASNGEDVTAVPIGSGPYEFVSQVAGSELKLKLNDGYWNAERGHYKNLTLEFFKSGISMNQALQSGRIDAADRLTANDVESLEKSKDLKIEVSETLSTAQMFVNWSQDKFKDVRVRQAINYALDVDQLAEVLTAGQGEAVRGVIPPNSIYGSKAVYDVVTHDPAKARSLVEAADADGITVECYTYAGSGFDLIGPYMMEQLGEVGIKLSVTERPNPENIAGFFVDKTDDCFLAGSNGSIAVYELMNSLYGTGFFNPGGPSVDLALFDELRNAFTVEEQKAVVEKIQLAALENPNTFGLATRPSVFAHKKTVSGYVPDTIGSDFALLKPAT